MLLYFYKLYNFIKKSTNGRDSLDQSSVSRVQNFGMNDMNTNFNQINFQFNSLFEPTSLHTDLTDYLDEDLFTFTVSPTSHARPSDNSTDESYCSLSNTEESSVLRKTLDMEEFMTNNNESHFNDPEISGIFGPIPGHRTNQHDSMNYDTIQNLEQNQIFITGEFEKCTNLNGSDQQDFGISQKHHRVSGVYLQ